MTIDGFQTLTTGTDGAAGAERLLAIWNNVNTNKYEIISTRSIQQTNV